MTRGTRECDEIDHLLARNGQFLSKLESYKRAVICEYVTGKNKVP